MSAMSCDVREVGTPPNRMDELHLHYQATAVVTRASGGPTPNVHHAGTSPGCSVRLSAHDLRDVRAPGGARLTPPPAASNPTSGPTPCPIPTATPSSRCLPSTRPPSPIPSERASLTLVACFAGGLLRNPLVVGTSSISRDLHPFSFALFSAPSSSSCVQTHGVDPTGVCWLLSWRSRLNLNLDSQEIRLQSVRWHDTAHRGRPPTALFRRC